jgi:hypothetical protein
MKNGRPFKFDWSAIQKDFDNGMDRGQCIAKYGFKPGGWKKAVASGHLKMPERFRTIDGRLEKVCAECGIFKPVQNFHRKRKTQYTSFCKSCTSIIGKSWRLGSKFGLTMDEYEEMKRASGGVCEACGDRETKIAKGTLADLAIDHDHVTGEIRGLLCNRCNRILGIAKENMEYLQRAADGLRKYLTKKPQTPKPVPIAVTLGSGKRPEHRPFLIK